MEKLLSLVVVMALVGCAESDNSAYAPKDGGKTDGAVGEVGVIPGLDSTPGEDVTASTDTGGGGSCTVNPGASSMCGTFPQCGCSDGQNCDVASTDGSGKCVTAGSGAENDTCSASATCGKGLSCIGSLCRPFCASDSDCGAGKCFNATYDPGTGTPMDVPGLKICFKPCDPRSPAAACGAGKGCAFVSADGTTGCTGAGSGVGTGACASDPNSCKAGYGCFGTGDCLQWCRPSHPTDCTGGGTCTSFGTPVYKDGVEYGYCQ